MKFSPKDISLKGISLGTNIKKLEKAPVYPTKRTINLVPEKERLVWTPKLVACAIVGAILIILFAKFAVIDVLGMAAQSNSKLSTARSELAALQQQNAQYPELQRQVAQYGAGGLSTEERALVNRAQVLSLISTTVGSRTDVQNVAVKGSTIEIQFLNANLSDVSAVVTALESSPLVESVTMDSSKSNAKSGVISTVTVTLVGGSKQASGTSTSTSSGSSASSGSTSSTGSGVRNG